MCIEPRIPRKQQIQVQRIHVIILWKHSLLNTNLSLNHTNRNMDPTAFKLQLFCSSPRMRHPYLTQLFKLQLQEQTFDNIWCLPLGDYYLIVLKRICREPEKWMAAFKALFQSKMVKWGLGYLSW